jgi:hypothetical protein
MYKEVSRRKMPVTPLHIHFTCGMNIGMNMDKFFQIYIRYIGKYIQVMGVTKNGLMEGKSGKLVDLQSLSLAELVN